MFFSVYSFILEVITPEPLDFIALQAHVPGIEVTENQKTDIQIVFKESSEPKLRMSLNRVVVEGSWCESFKHDFPHLIYAVMRKHWINKGLYPVHSICLENALVIGHSGTGKTTIALEALSQSMPIYSFNKTLVNFSEELKVCTGTKIATLKNGTVVYPEALRNEPAINKIYLFSVSEKEFQSLSLSPESALHQLYPYFMDTVKSDALLTQDLIYNGFVSDEAKKELLKNLKAWLGSHQVEVLIGSVNDILNHIKGHT